MARCLGGILSRGILSVWHFLRCQLSSQLTPFLVQLVSCFQRGHHCPSMVFDDCGYRDTLLQVRPWFRVMANVDPRHCLQLFYLLTARRSLVPMDTLIVAETAAHWSQTVCLLYNNETATHITTQCCWNITRFKQCCLSIEGTYRCDCKHYHATFACGKFIPRVSQTTRRWWWMFSVWGRVGGGLCGSTNHKCQANAWRLWTMTYDNSDLYWTCISRRRPSWFSRSSTNANEKRTINIVLKLVRFYRAACNADAV